VNVQFCLPLNYFVFLWQLIKCHILHAQEQDKVCEIAALELLMFALAKHLGDWERDDLIE